jgi:hypothetical protein
MHVRAIDTKQSQINRGAGSSSTTQFAICDSETPDRSATMTEKAKVDDNDAFPSELLPPTHHPS